MTNRVRVVLLIGIVIIPSIAVTSLAQEASSKGAALRAVRSFYTFHLARNKDFTARNIRLRKRWLTADLYKLLLAELKREEEERKAHPDEAPYFEGDPLTDSQESPDSFRTGKVTSSGDVVKVTVTLLWSARTSRGRDKRDIVVELNRIGTGWLIGDIINSDGKRLRDELKRSS